MANNQDEFLSDDEQLDTSFDDSVDETIEDSSLWDEDEEDLSDYHSRKSKKFPKLKDSDD